MARRLTSEILSEQPREPAPLSQPGQLPILCVDDRPENLQALEAVLEPLGVPVHTATSGEEALRTLLQRDFAVILLDVRMPGLDGLQTAGLIKARDRTRDTPIIFLTAARDEAGDIIRGYGVGAVDYVLKPFDAELLRSKVLVFAELEQGRRALKQSEAFLRGAFEAAPIGKTVLDSERRIARANPAFARIIGQEPVDLEGIAIIELWHPEDRDALEEMLDRAASTPLDDPAASTGIDHDVRLLSADGEVWVAPAASRIESAATTPTLLLVQWVDVTARRRGERARGELLLEQAARANAEGETERLEKLQRLAQAFESGPLAESLPELARRLSAMFSAEAAEVQIDDVERPIIARARGDRAELVEGEGLTEAPERLHQALLTIDGATLGSLRILHADRRPLALSERVLLADAADRVALLVRRLQLHEREHWIAVELQRGLLPDRLPQNPRVAIAAHYQAAGVGAEIGGDWYDAFALPGERLGVVVGDVTGSGIRAASTMGQLRSVTRAFAAGDDEPRAPGEVLTRLNRYLNTMGFADLFTILYAIIDPSAPSVRWASAGHPPPLLRRANGTTRVLEGTAGVLGFEDAVYDDRSLPLAASDSLIFYTDGLIERRGETIDDGLHRLSQAVASGPADPERLCAHILESTVAPRTHLQDDVTAVVLKLQLDRSHPAGGPP